VRSQSYVKKVPLVGAFKFILFQRDQIVQLQILVLFYDQTFHPASREMLGDKCTDIRRQIRRQASTDRLMGTVGGGIFLAQRLAKTGELFTDGLDQIQ